MNYNAFRYPVYYRLALFLTCAYTSLVLYNIGTSSKPKRFTMTHLRERIALAKLLTKLTFSPVVAIQGVRQCGKSVLARDLLSKKKKNIRYETLDNPVSKSFASTSSLSFLAQKEHGETSIIDEAQKVPSLFDSVKYLVDKKKSPGQFILLGSTEFSTLFRVRESLTGRMSKLRLYPLIVREAAKLSFSIPNTTFFLEKKALIDRGSLMLHLERGGMPGLFALRNKEERREMQNDWLELSCLRDIPNIPTKRYDGDLSMRILEQVARLEQPDIASIASSLRKDSRTIRKHLEALKTLFIIHELPAYEKGTGKSLYFLCDVGFASLLGACFEKKLWTWLIQEIYAKRSYSTDIDIKYYYYRNPKGSVIHLIERREHNISALKVIDHENITDLDIRLLRSFKQNIEHSASILALGADNQKRDDIVIRSWESVC